MRMQELLPFIIIELMNGCNISFVSCAEEEQEQKPFSKEYITPILDNYKTAQKGPYIIDIKKKPEFSTWPVTGYSTNTITDCFRYGEDYHYALDIRGRRADNARIVSAGAGEITYVDKEFGGEVQINHGSGISTGYIHLENIAVKEGDKVKAGEFLGVPGGRWDNEPDIFPDHLHFSVYAEEIPLNPICFFDESVSYQLKSLCKYGKEINIYCDQIAEGTLELILDEQEHWQVY